MSELLKAQNFGIEVEFTGITREEAANAIAEVIGSSRITAPTPNCYHARKVIGPDGRKWTVERDSSIDPQRSQKSKAQNESYDEFRVEFVTPIFMYFVVDIRNNTYYNNNVNRKEMKTVKTSELIKLLKKAGCTYVRDGGNHGIWYSPITGKTFPVWYHNKEIPTGTLNKIKKEAGI